MALRFLCLSFFTRVLSTGCLSVSASPRSGVSPIAFVVAARASSTTVPVPCDCNSTSSILSAATAVAPPSCL
ncbi:hypothetical protein TRIATDRAFT_256403 [Trichoderma atroviride IMI 206040]|uniref:Secreted protein n=1 Tax=Hypocrea atroviridis (strain ATCC 20476 / IMI 206040) TaxID=452589 RepID=G9NSL0_HYPAI|nr:uncharacterized protein TRIATDRAFT_256403 [Trichoderma atroviride IMI 206040]EHK46407.1 hypothetical protein TRIATDRAFT_256403 [Trichoderma atroviride IMI 206040]